MSKGTHPPKKKNRETLKGCKMCVHSSSIRNWVCYNLACCKTKGEEELLGSLVAVRVEVGNKKEIEWLPWDERDQEKSLSWGKKGLLRHQASNRWGGGPVVDWNCLTCSPFSRSQLKEKKKQQQKKRRFFFFLFVELQSPVGRDQTHSLILRSSIFFSSSF